MKNYRGFSQGFSASLKALFLQLCILIIFDGLPAHAKDTPAKNVDVKDNSASLAVNSLLDYSSRFHPVKGQAGIVSAQDRIAAQIGTDILQRGGNAIDAAVATGFALAVSHPQAGNLGGGGFMLVSLTGSDEVIALDFREIAPAAASRDMYLSKNGEVDNQKAQYSHLSAGVPGTVMGLLEALDTYGTMTRRQVMGPAIRLAANGFPASYGLAHSLHENRESLLADPSSREYFLNGGQGFQPGEIIKQTDLAATLRRIMVQGSDGFYTGQTADLIVAEMETGNGIMTHDDLENYRTITRPAVSGTYKDYEVHSMPPPSSGGIHILQMLNILQGYDLQNDGHNSAAYLHKLIEAMRRAFADRSQYLGDPDFFDVPQQALIDPDYADRLRATISLEKASRSADVRPGTVLRPEGPSTTHYSVIDKAGNSVAVTYTLNFSYGSGLSVDGAGFLLNNEMDDFSAKPGAPNGYGLIGGEANKIEPLKRPLSSMSPLIVTKDGVPVLVTGSPGGSTIITSVLQMVLNVIEWDMNLAQATNLPRIHHQWLPEIVLAEPGISPDTLAILEKMGHQFPKNAQGDIARTILGRVNSVGQLGIQGSAAPFFHGAADPRGPKSAAIAVP